MKRKKKKTAKAARGMNWGIVWIFLSGRAVVWRDEGGGVVEQSRVEYKQRVG